MNRGSVLILIIFTLFFASTAYGQTNTVTSTTSGTVTVDKTPPTASAPSVVVNNSDVCKSAYSAGVQTQILGIASGYNCLEAEISSLSSSVVRLINNPLKCGLLKYRTGSANIA